MAKRKTGAGSGINMQDLARVGAQARLDALREEQAALLAAFPGLRGAAAGQTRSGQARGKTVILIDDVLTTGSTAEACARTLKRAGAVRVELVSWARVVRPAQLMR